MILISKCLLNKNNQYQTNNNYLACLAKLYDPRVFYALCPAKLANLPTMPTVELRLNYPRYKGKRVLVDDSGRTWLNAESLEEVWLKRLVVNYDIKVAILKDDSPSCGVHKIYDGHFDGVRCSGMGIATSILQSAGVKCYAEQDLSQMELKNLIVQELQRQMCRERVNCRCAEDAADEGDYSI